MRFHSMRLRGISEAFRGEASVDFDALGPGLIAIVGQNGAGKSTLIGCLFASLFRQLPGQKRPLYDFATDQNPEIDVMFSVHNQRCRSLIKIDPKARQLESYLFTAEGKALTNGKKDSFQEAIERLVGSRSFYEASIFSNQKRIGNFLSLDRAQRKELFVEQLLGMGRLRGLCALAKDKNEDLKKGILSLEGELKGLESPLAQQVELPTLTSVEAALEEVSNQLFGEEARFQEAQQRLAEAQKQIGGLEPLEKELAELKRREQALTSEAATVENEIRGDELLLAQTPKTNGEPARLSGLIKRIDSLHIQVQEAQKVEARNREADTAIRVIGVELAGKQTEFARIQTECEELSAVPCGGQGEYAACPKIRRAVESQKLLPSVEQTIYSLENDRNRHQGSRVTLNRSSSELMRRLQEAEAERQMVEVVVRRQQEAKAVEARLNERRKTAKRLQQERRTLGARHQDVTGQLDSMQETRRKVAEEERTCRVAAGEVRKLQAKRETLIVQKAQIERTEQQRIEIEERIRNTRVRIEQIRTERDDWGYLATVFGPDEIQLLEIQSAGPAISEIVNELLEGCLENKFAIRFRTQRAKADGRGSVDDFDVEVTNKTLDRSFSVDELSGGQFVLVNEALNLGMAMYNAQKGEGVQYEMLFRDETIGALDAHNGVEYVRMLRRAMEVGGFHQVVFITHNPAVWDLADRVVRVADGTVRVEAAVTAPA